MASVVLPTPHLVLGGAKSGKSSFAENLTLACCPPHIYIATAQVLDEEMEERVRVHRERRKDIWQTIENPLDLVEILKSLQGTKQSVLVDCLTLWISNLLLSGNRDVVDRAVLNLVSFLDFVDYPLVLVANEVGGGIVPENPLAREFRDLAGIANQRVAAACRSVTLVVAGLPMRLK